MTYRCYWSSTVWSKKITKWNSSMHIHVGAYCFRNNVVRRDHRHLFVLNQTATRELYGTMTPLQQFYIRAIVCPIIKRLTLTYMKGSKWWQLQMVRCITKYFYNKILPCNYRIPIHAFCDLHIMLMLDQFQFNAFFNIPRLAHNWQQVYTRV